MRHRWGFVAARLAALFGVGALLLSAVGAIGYGQQPSFFRGWLSWACWLLTLIGLARAWIWIRRLEAASAMLWAKPEFAPIPPETLGPAGVRIVGPDGEEFPLVVVPFRREVHTGDTVWLAFGPQGRPLPAWGEIRIQVMPPRCSVHVQTEEDDNGYLVFAGVPAELDLSGDPGPGVP